MRIWFSQGFYLGEDISRGHASHSGVVWVHLPEEILVVLRPDHMVEDVVRCSPSRLAPLQLAGVHPVVLVIPGVDELGDELQPNGRLSSLLKPFRKTLSDVHPWSRLLDGFHLGRVLGLQ